MNANALSPADDELDSEPDLDPELEPEPGDLQDEVIALDGDETDEIDDADELETDRAALPAGSPATGPGVVVVHDWYGPLPHVADFADELTMAGFDVELVDVYDGATTRDPGRAEELAEALDGSAAREAITAAVERLKFAGARYIGAVGFSLGGSLVLRAARDGELDAVVVYYASGDPAEAARITCPVQLHLAAQDEFESADDIDAFVSALRAVGTPVDTFTYPGTEHSFANADVVLADPRAAEVALARTIGFLHARLAG